MRKALFICLVFLLVLHTAAAGTITVTSPNGDETLEFGKLKLITWSSSGITNPLKITLWKGGTRLGVIQNNIPANKTSIMWTVGHLQDGTAAPGVGYIIKIKEKDKPVEDVSDRSFIITTGKLDVTSPREGAKLVRSYEYWIRWDKPSTIPDNCFKVHLFRGSQFVMTLDSQVCEEKLHWEVPEIQDGPNYKIRVATTSGTAIGDSKFFAIASMMPDLVPTKVDVKFAQPGTEKYVTFKATITNESLGEAPPSRGLLTITGPDNFKRMYTLPVPGMVFGANKTITFSYNLPKAGRYNNLFHVDYYSEVDEGNESNNEKSIAYNVKKLPDLVVCYYPQYNVLIEAAALSVSNYNFGIDVWVKNVGEVASTPCRLRFWIEGKGVNYYDIPGLNPGQQHKVYRGCMWRTTGTSNFSLKIDNDNDVWEANEDNNTGQGNIKRRWNFAVQPPLKCSNETTAVATAKKK